MLGSLENKIGYAFTDRNLLAAALTHSSYANERKCESYERLEFLGDSILGFVTAEFLYNSLPDMPEGRMTRMRAELVCEESLHAVAEKLGICPEMRISRGADKTGVRYAPSVMADMVESIIAAIYLDSGLEEAKSFIYRMILDEADLTSCGAAGDFKSALQEFAQRDGPAEIVYSEQSEAGPDHAKVFTYSVSVNGVTAGKGTGKSKKEAEQAAARMALGLLNPRVRPDGEAPEERAEE